MIRPNQIQLCSEILEFEGWMLFLSDILTKAVARLKIDTDLERGLVLVYLAAYSVNVFFLSTAL